MEDATYIGVRAFVDARIDCPDLLAAIEGVLVGATLFTPDQLRSAHWFDDLTLRQVDIVRLAARGRSVAAIAERLGVTDHTVRNHLAEVRSRLGVHSTRAAVERAQRRGMI